MSAGEWIKTYTGSNIVKGYTKKYGVDKPCAIKELHMIGVQISDEYERQLKQSLEAQRKLKLLKQEKKEKTDPESEWVSDENFAVIIGYTSGGFPFGVTNEEMEDLNEKEGTHN